MYRQNSEETGEKIKKQYKKVSLNNQKNILFENQAIMRTDISTEKNYLLVPGTYSSEPVVLRTNQPLVISSFHNYKRGSIQWTET